MMQLALLVACALASASKPARPCDCGALAGAGAAERHVVPPSFASRNLSAQVVLLKVPETGSSTAANLLAEIAAARSIPSWVSTKSGEFDRVVAAPGRTAPKWALGHRGWGAWLHDLSLIHI